MSAILIYLITISAPFLSIAIGMACIYFAAKENNGKNNRSSLVEKLTINDLPLTTYHLPLTTTYRYLYNPIRHLAAFVVVFTMVFYPPLVFAASPVAGLIPDGSTNTTVDRAANGTPLLNIAAPNAGGMSHNNFTEYNVSSENLVINNFQGQTERMVTNTNLAGLVYANPNLVNGAARVILNEVTSNQFSTIAGYTEIAGSRADLIISNPNGVMINGGGFINTARLSVVAGRSNLDGNGNVKDFTIGNSTNSSSNLAGKILISARNVLATDGKGNDVIIALGLDANSTDYADIIARTVEVSGNIYANNLNILTGNDKAAQGSSGNFTVSSDGQTHGSAPTSSLAIDSSYLGGMYAGRISLIATEAGLGVRTRGDLVADVGDIDMNAAGDVSYANVVAKNGDVNITTSNNGNLNSLDSSSLISAHNKTNLNIAGIFNNLGEVNGNNVAIAASDLSNYGSLIATGAGLHSLRLDLTGLLNNYGNIYALGQLDITADTINNNGNGFILSNDLLSLTANYLTNSASARVKSDNILSFYITNLINNGKIQGINKINFNNLTGLTNSGAAASIYSKNDLSISLASLANSNNAIISSDGTITINATNIVMV